MVESANADALITELLLHLCYSALMASSSSDGPVIRKFLEAVSNGNLELVKRLVPELHKKGLVVTNVKDCYGKGALHIAALVGNTPICKYLTEELKLDVNMKDQEEKTSLYHAIAGDRFPTAKYLLGIGADPNESDSHGFTPMHLAIMKEHTELLRLLISKGAKVDADGTPLLLASTLGKKEAVKILLEHNANATKVCNHYQSPLAVAIITGALGVVQTMLEAGVDVNIGPCGATPLEMAVSQEKVEITRCLLKAGADPNVVNMHGDSPIETAALRGQREIVAMLLPITTRNPKVQDWSFSGILKYYHSDEVIEQKNIKRQEYFMFAKSKGGEEVKKGYYQLALYWYNEAFGATFDRVNHATMMSNRSFCHAKMRLGAQALSDARDCVRLRPDWPKGYYRAGVALTLLKRFPEAADSFHAGMSLDPGNKELEAAYWEAARAEP